MPFPNIEGSTVRTSVVQRMDGRRTPIPLTYSEDGLPVIMFFGEAENDADIVTDIGPDSYWGDGSFYVSVKNGAGKLFQKVNDVWVQFSPVGPGDIDGSHLASGIFRVSLVDGQNGAQNAVYTVSGVEPGDEIVFVGLFSTKAAIATLDDVTADFAVTDDDEITDSGATDYTNDLLQIIWIDKTP